MQPIHIHSLSKISTLLGRSMLFSQEQTYQHRKQHHHSQRSSRGRSWHLRAAFHSLRETGVYERRATININLHRRTHIRARQCARSVRARSGKDTHRIPQTAITRWLTPPHQTYIQRQIIYIAICRVRAIRNRIRETIGAGGRVAQAGSRIERFVGLES